MIGAPQPKFHDANIDSENIYFSYPRPSLCAGSLQFSYRRGQRVCLAGSSGAGKSAVLTLLHGRAIRQPARAPAGQDSVKSTTRRFLVVSISRCGNQAPQHRRAPCWSERSTVSMFMQKPMSEITLPGAA
jgi:ABC-type transport system involved in cytochrome bd biosynthesis fused ATPase/permease subunit